MPSLILTLKAPMTKFIIYVKQNNIFELRLTSEVSAKQYNMELPGALLSPSSKKKLKIFLELSSSKIKKFFIFQEIGLSSSSIKKFLIFSQKKAFLIFRDMELFYILGNGNLGKVPYISRNGTFLYFGKRKSRKNSLYFRKRNFFIF